MKPTTEQLAIINSRLPGTKVTAEQVEVLPFMAFDQRQTDRYTEMTPEMMRKIELDMNEGRVAFNALHRSQSTLPMGRSINARIVGTELQANMYAVHTRPDGTPFDDAKDLVDKYNTGAVYACSLGVNVGLYRCSICGNDIRDWNSCDHIPGRTYAVNEVPKLCIAYMTGRDIQNGVAMDCGAYELSGVTAGGVTNAGVLTATFGKYESGADATEFKKTAFETAKDMSEFIMFHAHTSAISNQEEKKEVTMQAADIKALVEEYTKEVVTDKIKVEEAYKTIKADYDQLKEAVAAVNAEFDKATTELTALKETFAAAEASLEVTKAFQVEYLAIVEAAGNKLGKTADYAAMTLDTLKTTYATYCDEINELPVGQLSAGELTETAVFSAIPDSCYKA